MTVSLTLFFYSNRSAVKFFAHTPEFLRFSEDKSYAPFFLVT